MSERRPLHLTDEQLALIRRASALLQPQRGVGRRNQIRELSRELVFSGARK
jgi:hypothetical protein